MSSGKTFGRHSNYDSRNLAFHSHKADVASEDSDSDEDEKERRKYLSLQGGQSFFWSANKLNKNFSASKTECFDDMYCNYFADRTSSMSSFKRNVQLRHSLKNHRREPLVNLQNLDLYEKFDKSKKHTRLKTLDEIELNNNFEYGFNPQRSGGVRHDIQIRLRPASICTPIKNCDTLINVPNSDSRKDTCFTLANLSPNIISYARNEYESELEKQVLYLRSQSCSLNFHGCQGNLNEKELKEDLAMARRRRFVRRKLSFDYRPKKKWKKTVSLDSGLATDNILSKPRQTELNSSKSEELLQDCDVKKTQDENRKTSKSVEFLDVRDECEDRLDVQFGEVENEVESKALSDPEIDDILNIETEVLTPEELMEPMPDFSTDNVNGEIADEPVLDNSYDNTDSYKTGEKIKRTKSSIPYIFSALKLPNKSTFKKLIRRKNNDSPTLMKKAHKINSDLVPDKQALSDELTDTEDAISRSKDSCLNTIGVLRDLAVVSPNQQQGSIQSKNQDKSVTLICDEKVVSEEILNKTYSLDEMESVSMNSLHDYAKSVDKSVSAYSLPRVDEDKEFGNSLERRSRSSCSISFIIARKQWKHKDGLSRRMSEIDVDWERKKRPSPGKKFMRRLLSPVVCGLSSPDKYGMFNDSIHSLNSLDSTSLASDSEHNSQLFDFPVQDLVEEMTLIDKELLIHIPWEELSVLGWMSPDKLLLAPNVMKMVQFFNRIAMLVTTNVLVEETSHRRAKVIKKAIQLAFKCREVKNYNSLKAVLGGLQCTPVFRLKASWKEVPSRYRRIFRNLSELMSEENNFDNYRSELSMALLDPPCVPFLGNFLTEVAHTHAFQAIHAKYRATTVFVVDGKESWKNAIKESKLPDDGEYSNIESDERILHNGGKIFSQPDSNRTESDSSDQYQVKPEKGYPRTNSEHSNLSLSDHPQYRCFKFHSHTDSENSTPGLLGNPQYRTGKNHSRTNSEHSNPASLVNHPQCRIGKNHSRTDSSDSGVALSLKRYSNCSEDLGSQQESCLSSPDEEPHNEKGVLRNNTSYKFVKTDRQLLQKDSQKESNKIHDDLYSCECMFWKLQISCVQYNYVKRPYICRYLENCPYDTEEDSYKLSLQREPPKR